MLLKWIAKLVVAINSNSRPGEIGAGIACGIMLALIPVTNLLWVALFVLTLFWKINLAAELVIVLLFKLFVALFDPLLHSLGYAVLTAPALFGLLTALSNAPLTPLTRFNNTIVMGGFLAGIVLWVPCFLLFRRLVIVYRERLRDRIANSKAYKAFVKLPLVSTVIKLARRIGSLAAAVG